jgi:hypothetical protein
MTPSELVEPSDSIPSLSLTHNIPKQGEYFTPASILRYLLSVLYG